MISLIVNTACMDPMVKGKKQLYANKPYGARAEMLHDIILPYVREQFDEVLVVGAFERGEGYQYIPMPPLFRDRRDALWQRELGARHSRGSILAFSHDDHLLKFELSRPLETDWDILVPRREDRDGNELNNGRLEGYMGGHSLFMTREMWAQVPWTSVNTEWWDVTMTRVWRESGARILWTEGIVHVDLDATIDNSVKLMV